MVLLPRLILAWLAVSAVMGWSRAPVAAVRRTRVAATPEPRPKKSYYDYRRANDGEAHHAHEEQPTVEECAPVMPDRVSGQERYHHLHADEIEDGILAHLREMGLGLFDDLDGGEAGGAPPPRFKETAAWRALDAHASAVERDHLRALLEDAGRARAMTLEAPGVFLDWSRQKVTAETMALLFDLARDMDVPRKVEAMRRGERINTSERRAVLHTALRAPRCAATDPPFLGEAVRASCDVRDRLLAFVDAVRTGAARTVDGARFDAAVVVGIGGSYLGPEFLAQATAGVAAPAKDGDPLDVRFLANVDPAAFAEATRGLDPRRTLAIVVSKSWSTAETLRNGAAVRDWICAAHGDRPRAAVVRAHFVACASRTAADAVAAWGVDADARLFEFWNWVGGRYSASASAGLLPLALARGSRAARDFLAGAHAMDEHFFTTPLERNVPAVMALLGVWNVNFLGLGARAVVPYAEPLRRFAAHVQQLEMESHGKSVTEDGAPLDFTTGEIVVGEPGTNAQHSFFQLLHQGQAVPTDFIGFLRPDDATTDADGHDELMANFFAQPDALAVGRSFDDVLDDARFGDGDVANCPHRTLSGDRPSLTLLLDKLDAYHVGALLALYEHRCAVQGFVWGINSFDQWGVELGKKLAADVRAILQRKPTAPRPHNPSTAALLDRYVAARDAAAPPHPRE